MYVQFKTRARASRPILAGSRWRLYRKVTHPLFPDVARLKAAVRVLVVERAQRRDHELNRDRGVRRNFPDVQKRAGYDASVR